jgi:hypothetical protein
MKDDRRYLNLKSISLKYESFHAIVQGYSGKCIRYIIKVSQIYGNITSSVANIV